MRLYYVGRIVERQKRFSRIIQLAELLASSGSYIEIMVFGHAFEVPAIPQSITSNIKFMGSSRNWLDQLRKTDVMIIVSDYEGCPLSLLEAQYAGFCNVLSLNFPGIGTYISDNCICKNLREMADQIIAGNGMGNNRDLATYFNQARFDAQKRAVLNIIHV